MPRRALICCPTAYASRARTACPSSRSRAMSAAWAHTGPAPVRGRAERAHRFLPDLDELLDEADRLLGVRPIAFDGAPFTELVRDRLAAAFDAGRPPTPGPADAARRPPGATAPCLVRLRCRLRRRHPTQPELRSGRRLLVTRVLLEDGSRRRFESATAQRSRARGAGPLRRSRRGRVAHAAAALGLRQSVRPALGRMLNDQSQVVFATRLRDQHPAPHAAAPPESRPSDDTAGVASRAASAGCRSPTRSRFTGRSCSSTPRRCPSPSDDPAVPGSIVGLGLFLRRRPAVGSDRVEFDGRRDDAYGMPAMRIHYRLTSATGKWLDRAQRRDRAAREAVGEPDRRSPRSRCRSAPRCTIRARRGWARPTTARGVRAGQRGLGLFRALRRRQRRHPDVDRLQPDAHLGRTGCPRCPNDCRRTAAAKGIRGCSTNRHDHDRRQPAGGI